VYDVVNDPGETKNIAASANLSREVRATLRDYPIPSLQAAASSTSLADEERKKLASLGYVSSDVKPIIRADAPRPADMTALFPILDKASGLFVREQYAEAIPLLEQILARDPHNLDAALRLATAHSALGHDAEALAGYRRAQSIAPDSPDVQTYLALHQARGAEWKEAAPLLEKIVNENPNRVPALEALATIREREGRLGDAIALRQRVFALRTPAPQELVKLGNVAMENGDTATAIDAFEKARAAQGKEFHNNLELGVLYLSSRRFEDARAALDRVSPKHPAYPLALFKRAQVSVLLNEPDAAARIAAARAGADAMTRRLIAQEKLFANR
jgi:tetratricopeptide (TPR) repeat protein